MTITSRPGEVPVYVQPTQEFTRVTLEGAWNVGYAAGLVEAETTVLAPYPESLSKTTGSKSLDQSRKRTYSDGAQAALEDLERGGDLSKNPYRRTDFETHDEVAFADGTHGFIIERVGVNYDATVATGTLAGMVAYNVEPESLDFISRPERPLTSADAEARHLPWPDVSCAYCGDHGVQPQPRRGKPRTAAGDLFLCAAHTHELAIEFARHDAVVARLSARRRGVQG